MAKYIDADALIMKLADYALASSPNENDDADIRMMDKTVYDAINECIKAVEEMPAADVEPVRKWIPIEERMPPEGYDVLLNFADNLTVGNWLRRHDNNTPCWYVYSDNGYYTSCDNEPTHWKWMEVMLMSEWIPCSERLPEGYEDVIVCKDNGTVESGYYLPELNMWMNANESAINVEFWQPLPEPPRMDGGSE
ncbi:MAG: DUF551 domain-containing protein [Clostridiales bacterium]|nr:DUF551 domain-containing protein [Clostridiales bacterium]